MDQTAMGKKPGIPLPIIIASVFARVSAIASRRPDTPVAFANKPNPGSPRRLLVLPSRYGDLQPVSGHHRRPAGGHLTLVLADVLDYDVPYLEPVFQHALSFITLQVLPEAVHVPWVGRRDKLGDGIPRTAAQCTVLFFCLPRFLRSPPDERV